MTDSDQGDLVLRHLVELARAQRSEVSWRERRFLEHFDERMSERRAARRASSRRRAWVGATLVAACAAVFLVIFYPRPSLLSYEVAGGAVTAGYIESRGNAEVRFSDGTRLNLANGTRARVDEVTEHGSRVKLERGEARLNVVKTGHSAWVVNAGPYSVRVTGTAFDVRWSKEAQRFELDLHQGSVAISGPAIDGSIALQAGEKLIGVANGPVRIEGRRVAEVHAARADEPGQLPLAAHKADSEVRSAAGSEPAARPEPVPSSAPPAEVEQAPPVATPQATDPSKRIQAEGDAPRESRPNTVRPSVVPWDRLVAEGKFQDVIESAKARGLTQVLSSGALGELAALADAARYARNPDLARQTLLSTRRRFPGSRPARDAAFFLGGLEEGNAPAAVEWYERYLAESPKGLYTSQALGRRLILVYRMRGSQAAAPLARDYLERFSNGPYASAARKIRDGLRP